MSDINRIPQSPSTGPANVSKGPNAIDIATNSLGQRIEKTTEGVTSQATSSSSGGSNNTAFVDKESSKIKTSLREIPSTEEELIKTIRQHLEEQIDSLEAEVDHIRKQGGKGMAYRLTEKFKELRKLHGTIRSLYEVAKTTLTEIYKSLFNIA